MRFPSVIAFLVPALQNVTCFVCRSFLICSGRLMIDDKAFHSQSNYIP